MPHAADPEQAGDPLADAPLRDLFAVANALAAVLGAAVTIEDTSANLLAYSNLDQPIDDARRDTILGRGHPDNWARRLEEEQVPQRLRASTDAVVRIDDPTGQLRPRLVTLIRAGAEVLGSVWVVEGHTPIGADTEAALKQSVPSLALHMLRHRESDDVSHGERAGLLRALLDGSSDPAAAAAGLGLDVDTACAVVAFRLTTDDELDLSVTRSRAVDMVTVACEAFRRRVVCGWVGQTIYALFPALAPDSAAQLVSLAETICGRAKQSLGSPLYAGIGTTVTGMANARRSRDEADRAVRLLLSEGSRTVASIDDVRVQSVLLELGDLVRDRASLRLPVIDEISAYDDAHGKDYLPTLRAYAAAYGDAVRAGATLTLHPNTVRYRVRRLEELFGLDLGDPEQLLAISLQFLGARGPATGPRAAE